MKIVNIPYWQRKNRSDASTPSLVEMIEQLRIPTPVIIHDPKLATMATQVTVLDDNRIIRQGSPRGIFGTPENLTIACPAGFTV